MLKRLMRVLILALAIAVSTSACGGGSAKKEDGQKQQTEQTKSDKTSSKVLKFGLSAEPSKLEPIVQAGTAQRTVKLSIYRGLVNYNQDGKINNELAESYSVSPDGKTYTFKLRDAKFHNGDPVTADDVKYTFERISDPKKGATYRQQLSIIDKIDSVDKKTVTITLKETSAPFIHYLALPESVIVSKSWTESKNGDLNAAPMGAGPFQFVSWDKGQNITVKKFDGYYKKDEPKVDSIKFVFFTDEDARGNALRAGDVDIIEYVAWKDMAAIEKDKNLKLDSQNGPFMMLQFNTHSKPLGDPKVRQAISYAIDRTSVINTAFNGRGNSIYGLAIPEGFLGYNKKYDNYFQYSPDKAKALLAEAGYPNGFKIRLLSTSTYSYHQQTAVAVQAELKKVGIDVQLDLPDWATRIKKNTEGDYDMVVTGTAGDITDPDWLSNFFYGAELGLNNSAYFNDAQINKLLDDGRKTLDENKRKEIYEQFDQRALELSPLVFLSWREQSYAMKSSVTGFKNMPGFLSFQSGIMLEKADIK